MWHFSPVKIFFKKLKILSIPATEKIRMVKQTFTHVQMSRFMLLHHFNPNLFNVSKESFWKVLCNF